MVQPEVYISLEIAKIWPILYETDMLPKMSYPEMYTKETKDTIEHAGYKSKSGQPVRPYSTSGTLFFYLLNKYVKTLQERLK